MIQLNLFLDVRKREEHECGKARGRNPSIWYGGDTQGTRRSSVNMQGGTIKAKYDSSGNNLRSRHTPKAWHSWEQELLAPTSNPRL